MELIGDRALPIHVDGEPWATPAANVRRLEVTVVPGAIQLLT
jgi:hypothetical protein